MNQSVLRTKRRRVAKQMPPIQKILRGSIVVVKRYCGKSSCRCLKGHKHRALYISRSQKGRPRLVYIPQSSEAEVRKLIGNHQKMKALMERISEINLRRVTAGAAS